MSGQGPWTVTPEAVVVELPTATLGTRAPARLLDLLIEGFAAGVLVALVAEFGGGVAVLVAVAVLSFAALFVYPAAMETLAGGRTVGKMAAGIRVVSTEGAPIGFRQAAIRAVLSPVDILAGAPAMLISSRDQRLGDLAAGTVVVRYRGAASRSGMAWFPPPYGLEAFAAGLDTSGLAEADYELLRSYLLRWSELSPAPRLQIGIQLARRIAAHLHHNLPAWIGPDQYLACVAASYQRRQGIASPQVPYSAPASGWHVPVPPAPTVAGPVGVLPPAGPPSSSAGGPPAPAGPFRPPS